MQTSRNSRPRKRSGRATRRVPIEALEPRLCMALSVGWDGPGRGGTALNYYIGAVPASLNAAQVESALTTALNAWSAVADIRFTRTSVPQQLDSLDFTFRAIDGAGRALAQGYLPDDVNPARIAGDIQFDSAESWEIGNARGNAAFDLTLVAVHEIGHALGLDHINAADSVMRPSVSASQTFAGLGASDQSAILALYAAADGNSDTPTTPETPTTPTTPTPRRTPPFGRRGRFGRAEGAPEAPHQLFSASSRWQNGENASDVNGDESVTPNDVLRIVNRLNSSGARPLGDDDAATTDFVDCNGDSQLSPLGALIVINS
ncbi:MAG: matrixin family metalloprotease, partial [Pirellulaceae bacterium]